MWEPGRTKLDIAEDFLSLGEYKSVDYNCFLQHSQVSSQVIAVEDFNLKCHAQLLGNQSHSIQTWGSMWKAEQEMLAVGVLRIMLRCSESHVSSHSLVWGPNP